MLSINVVCVGKLKEKFLSDGVDEYAKRIRPFAKLSLTEIDESRLPDSPSEAQIQKGLDTEADKILKACGKSKIIALCIEGKKLDSVAFSGYLSKLSSEGVSTVSFVIGSSFGLSDKVKKEAVLKLSFSDMTFPHQLARLMLFEQIYRACQIEINGKYHK